MNNPVSHQHVIPLRSLSNSDVKFSGHKAQGLARLMTMGLPVPEGFCVTTRAYQDHAMQSGIGTLVKDLGGEDARPVLAAIREKLLTAPLGPTCEAAVRKSYGALGAPLVSVRSSSTMEDTSSLSFAGLYDTFLGVSDADSCMMSIKKCWASLWTERVFRYMARHGQDYQAIFMAVVVQRLIRADSSGVIFTGVGTAGSGRIVIEACRGLGEVLVSGKTTPDRFVIHAGNLGILERHYAQKSLKVEATDHGALKEIPLSGSEGRKPSIDDRAVKRLANLARDAASRHPEGPTLDMEWALEKGEILLLQCRPVTARPEEAKPLRIYSCANLGEVLPDVATPLTASFVKELIEIPFLGNFRKLGLDFGESTVVALVNGRFYYDMTALASIMRLLPGNQGDTIGDLMGGHQQKLVGRLLARQKAGDDRKLRVDWPVFLRAYPRLLWRMLTSRARGVDRVIERLNAENAAITGDELESCTAPRLLEWLETVTRLMCEHIPEGAAAVSGGLPGLLALKRVCASWLDDRDGSLAGRLLIASRGIEPADSALALSSLAALARSDTRLESLLRKEESFARVSVHLPDMPGGKEFLQGWNDFMARHGHHSRGEFELSKPRWSEAPDYVLSLVKSSMDGRDIVKEYQDHARERELLINECRKKLKNPLRRMIFDTLLTKASRGLSLRERYKSETIRQIAAMRRMYLALGRNYVSRGIVEREDDIFFLTPGEIQSLQREDASFSAREVIAERRIEYEENCRLPSFPVILDDSGEKRYIPYEADGALEFLTGLGVCPGCARGPARVVLPGAADIRVQPGEILVIPHGDPGWSPYFAASAGIVMDMGGMLSHGSIIAREYGIPTVVNVGPATEIIRTGQVIEVDGTRGIVLLAGEGGIPRDPGKTGKNRGQLTDIYNSFECFENSAGTW